MPTPPQFSVVIPTHLRPRLLSRALRSIKQQSIKAEVIVVSDAIDPETDAVCSSLLDEHDVYIRRNGPPGPSASRNLALSLAQGRYVLFLDDDDAWHPEMLQSLHTHPSVQQGLLVYFNCSVVKERRPSGRDPEILSETILDLRNSLTDKVYLKNQVHMSCFSFPRSLLGAIAFDLTMRAYEDWDFLLSVFDKQMPTHAAILGSRVYEVDDETTDRRGSSDNATNLNAVLDYLYVYRRHPARSNELAESRFNLLQSVGFPIDPHLL